LAVDDLRDREALLGELRGRREDPGEGEPAEAVVEP
jgi:hypothetical protein